MTRRRKIRGPSGTAEPGRRSGPCCSPSRPTKSRQVQPRQGPWRTGREGGSTAVGEASRTACAIPAGSPPPAGLSSLTAVPAPSAERRGCSCRARATLSRRRSFRDSAARSTRPTVQIQTRAQGTGSSARGMRSPKERTTQNLRRDNRRNVVRAVETFQRWTRRKNAPYRPRSCPARAGSADLPTRAL